jgi:hypothetical protein
LRQRYFHFLAIPRLPCRDRAPMFSGVDDETVEDMAAQPQLSA